MRFNNIKKRLIRKLKFLHLKKTSLKLSNLYKKLLNSKLNIYDIGAGQRMLPEIINFDGISKIHLIDPNKNLDYSYNQLKNYFFDHKNIFKFKSAISDKTKIQKYYESRVSTISTFAISNNNSKKYSNFYSKPSRQTVYSFKDFLKVNNLQKPDMVKIDVEGLELKVLNSILSCSDPFLIQIEANMNNPIFEESFSAINSILNKKNYFLYTLFPSYGDYDFSSNQKITNNSVNLNDIETNFNKKFLLQSECYYLKKKTKYNMKQFVLISGFGLSSLFLEKFEKNKKKIGTHQRKVLSRIYNIIK